MQTQLIDQLITYTGRELRSHWIYEQTGVLGDALVAFIGPCNVTTAHMVDLEDVRHNRPIYSQVMLHFIGEFFSKSLTETILLQRLLISQVQQQLMGSCQNLQIIRTGNDLYEGEAKLTVSIASASPISTLLHAGLNIVSEGTPVLTKGLRDYNLEPLEFARTLLSAFKQEYESLQRDRCKVKPTS